MKKIYLLYIIFLLAFLFSGGCGSQANRVGPDPTPLRTALAASTATFASPVLSPTIKPSPTLTLTPIPTLPKEDALETFLNLIEEDTECELPCWLRITPGQTKFDAVENIFSQFSAIASTKFSPASAYMRVFFPNFETAVYNTATEIKPTEDGGVSQILVYAVVNPDAHGNINYSNSEFQRVWQRYFVPGIFTRHGAPEKIFLDTTRVAADPTTSYPFVLWIVYPEQGFLMRYEGSNTKVGDNIRICPMQSRIEIKIWNTEKLSYENIIKDDRALGISTSLGPQPIEDVTDFSIESFYEKFKTGKLNTCFETPASLWPH